MYRHIISLTWNLIEFLSKWKQPIKIHLVGLLLLALCSTSQAQNPGSLDTSFNPNDIGFGFGDGFDSQVEKIALQKDGKIIAVGSFFTIDGIARNGIARLNTDRTLDTSFEIGLGFSGMVFDVAIQDDGKILVGGNFNLYNNIPSKGIARLNPDGSIDATFDIGTGVGGRVLTLDIQDDGKIIVAGNFLSYNGIARQDIIRLNPDGSLDTSFDLGAEGFNDPIDALAIQEDGKILLGGFFTTLGSKSQNRIARLNADGSPDSTFQVGTGFNFFTQSITIQDDGKILVGGPFSTYNGESIQGFARLNTNGSLDTTFNLLEGGVVSKVIFQEDGKIIVGASSPLLINGLIRGLIVRFNADWSLDTTFNPGEGASSSINDIVIQSDGKYVVGGLFRSFDDKNKGRIARLNTNGSLDPSFDIGTAFNDNVNDILIQSNGQIVAIGDFDTYDVAPRKFIARLDADGSLDTGFNPGENFNDNLYAIAQDANGKILMGGRFTSFDGTARNGIARLNADGSLDTTFDPGQGFDDEVLRITVQADGKILVGGDFTSFDGTSRNYIARLNADGSLDTTFDPGQGFDGDVNAIVLQANGKILVGGDFTSYDGTAVGGIARLNTDGSIDSNFTIGTGFDDEVERLLLQPDGKILVIGFFENFNDIARLYMARLNADGSLDTDFDTGVGPDDEIYALALEDDGQIIVGGTFGEFDELDFNGIARLNPDGSVDNSFDVGAGVRLGDVYALTLQNDGKILVGGSFIGYDEVGRNRIARVFSGESNNPPITVELCPSQDAFLQNGSNFNNNVIRLETGNRSRIGYLQYDLSQLSGDILSASLVLTVPNAANGGDAGSGEIKVFLGDSNDWTEINLNTDNAPERAGRALLGELNTNYALGQSYSFILETPRIIPGENLSLIVESNADGGNDVAFGSKENAHALCPTLVLLLRGDVTAPNQDPIAAFTPNNTSGTAPLTVSFDASASSDSDGNIVSYAWDFGDGNTATGVNASNTFAAGTYTVKLTVTDDDGATDETTQTITVSPASGGTTAELCPTQDAYLENGNLFNNNVIRLETGNRSRVGYLQYDLSQISGTITSAQLKLTVPNKSNGGDAGSGEIQVFLGDSNAWTEANLASNTPGKDGIALGTLNTNYGLGQSTTFTLDPSRLSSGGLLSLILQSNAQANNDVAFGSKENAQALCPTLILEIDGGGGSLPTGPSIMEFRLINASSDQDLGALTDNSVVDVNAPLSIQALTSPAQVGSVIFQLSGPVSRNQTENISPYALFGDNNGDFNGVNLTPGDYTLTATAYSSSKGTGDAGTALSINFTVVDNLSRSTNAVMNQALDQSTMLYPNPSVGEVTLDLHLHTDQIAEIFIYDQNGQVVQSRKAQGIQQLNLNNIAPGIYLVRIRKDGKEELKRLIVR